MTQYANPNLHKKWQTQLLTEYWGPCEGGERGIGDTGLGGVVGWDADQNFEVGSRAGWSVASSDYPSTAATSRSRTSMPPASAIGVDKNATANRGKNGVRALPHPVHRASPALMSSLGRGYDARALHVPYEQSSGRAPGSRTCPTRCKAGAFHLVGQSWNRGGACFCRAHRSRGESPASPHFAAPRPGLSADVWLRPFRAILLLDAGHGTKRRFWADRGQAAGGGADERE